MPNLVLNEFRRMRDNNAAAFHWEAGNHTPGANNYLLIPPQAALVDNQLPENITLSCYEIILLAAERTGVDVRLLGDIINESYRASARNAAPAIFTNNNINFH